MSHTLCLDGLPPWMTSAQLNLLCLLYGQTISAQVIPDRNGRSLQFGVVEMATEEDARQVITALDGTDELDERTGLSMWRRFAEKTTAYCTSRLQNHGMESWYSVSGRFPLNSPSPLSAHTEFCNEN